MANILRALLMDFQAKDSDHFGTAAAPRQGWRPATGPHFVPITVLKTV